MKGDKPELVVQKLTELGIDRIVPFRAERSVVRWDEAKAGQGGRRGCARWPGAAAAQCHRPWLPEVAEVADLAGLLAASTVWPWPSAAAARCPTACTTVLVGPEGGLGAGRGARRPAARSASGPNVLRAETAAITAGVRADPGPMTAS